MSQPSFVNITFAIIVINTPDYSIRTLQKNIAIENNRLVFLYEITFYLTIWYLLLESDCSIENIIVL